ncbi:hypothetical protein BH20PSE1_BH20PSE1_07040 [soil metagenome]
MAGLTPSHAKDDPTDAELQLELLTRNRDKLKPLRLQGCVHANLSTWSNSAEAWWMTGCVSQPVDLRAEAVLPALQW